MRYHRLLRRATALGAAAALVVLAGACGDAEMEEVPEVAEVETEPMEGEIELDEELILGPDDVGETIMATGWVSGVPLASGFFLRTEGNRVIFVESDQTVSAGDVVRAIGPLRQIEVAVFEGWEADAFDAGFEAEWDVLGTWVIDATTVTPMTGGAPETMDSPAGGMEAPDTMAPDVTTGDTVSGRG